MRLINTHKNLSTRGQEITLETQHKQNKTNGETEFGFAVFAWESTGFSLSAKLVTIGENSTKYPLVTVLS